MSSYLITGGAGFIGSHLADRLIEQGHKVTIIDDFSSGKMENVNKKCKVIKGSITERNSLAEAFVDIDFCYHLAAIASVQKSVDDWVNSHLVNLSGSVSVFAESAKRGIPVIYASSAAIYGDCKLLPIEEDQEKITPASPYGLDKYICEQQAALFAKFQGLKNLGLRFFNVYGPRQDPSSPYSGVISVFTNRIMNDQPINIYGDGSQERDFISVNDVVNILIKAQDFTSVESEVYNVATGKSTSINELAEILFEISGKKLPVSYLPAREGDIYKSLASNRKILNKMLIPCPAALNSAHGKEELKKIMYG